MKNVERQPAAGKNGTWPIFGTRRGDEGKSPAQPVLRDPAACVRRAKRQTNAHQ